MRLLYLVHQFFPNHYTGTERVTLDLAMQMQRMGHSPRVLTYEPDPNVDGFEKCTDKIQIKRYSYDTIPVVALRHEGPVDFSDIFHPAVEEAFKKLGFDCDLIHIFHPMWLSGVARVCKSAGIPSLMTLTDPWLLCPRALLDVGYRLCNGPDAGETCAYQCKLRMKSRYEDARTLYHMVDEVASGSRFLPTLFRHNGWNRSVRIIPHSINYRYVRRSGTPSQGKVTFGFIGSIAWHKGLHVLIRAIGNVPYRNVTVKIYGGYEQPDYFAALLDLAKGDERIQFLNPFRIEALPDIMRDISVMVIPSTYYENYPLVMLIAMAYQIPVIASNIGGMREVIRHGSNGLLFKMGDAEELADIIRQIAEKPEVLQKLRSNILMPRRTEEEALDYENIYRCLTHRK